MLNWPRKSKWNLRLLKLIKKIKTIKAKTRYISINRKTYRSCTKSLAEFKWRSNCSTMRANNGSLSGFGWVILRLCKWHCTFTFWVMTIKFWNKVDQRRIYWSIASEVFKLLFYLETSAEDRALVTKPLGNQSSALEEWPLKLLILSLRNLASPQFWFSQSKSIF